MKKQKPLNKEELAGIIVGCVVEMKERTVDPIDIGYRISQILDSLEGVEF